MLRNNQTYQPCKYIVFEGCFYDINDNDDDGNYSHDNNHNNVDDNDNNYKNDNGDQTIMIFQTMHFREPFICEKAESLAFTQIYERRS